MKYLFMVWIIGTGPLTQNGEQLYQTFSIRFLAGHSMTIKSGYYADWLIKEHNVTSSPALSQCRHCRQYCYHGYKYAAQSCASSCQCVENV